MNQATRKYKNLNIKLLCLVFSGFFMAASFLPPQAQAIDLADALRFQEAKDSDRFINETEVDDMLILKRIADVYSHWYGANRSSRCDVTDEQNQRLSTPPPNIEGFYDRAYAMEPAKGEDISGIEEFQVEQEGSTLIIDAMYNPSVTQVYGTSLPEQIDRYSIVISFEMDEKDAIANPEVLVTKFEVLDCQIFVEQHPIENDIISNRKNVNVVQSTALRQQRVQTNLNNRGLPNQRVGTPGAQGLPQQSALAGRSALGQGRAGANGQPQITDPTVAFTNGLMSGITGLTGQAGDAEQGLNQTITSNVLDAEQAVSGAIFDGFGNLGQSAGQGIAGAIGGIFSGIFGKDDSGSTTQRYE